MMRILLSNRAIETPASPIRRLAGKAKQAEAKGRRVYYLNIGQPDVISPPEFFEGVRQFNKSVLAYERSEGNDALRSAWISYMNRTIGLHLVDQDMLITTGASEALIFTFMTCCDPGDDVLIFDPTYANYMGFAAICGVRLRPVITKLKEQFSLPTIDEIGAKVTNRTRAILLCSPNNPTGAVYSREQLENLLELCERQRIFLVVDETYRELVFDGSKPLSVFHIAPDSPSLIVIDSLSKRFSLCGARIGCMLTKNEEVLVKTLALAQARLASPTIEQAAAAYMLNHLEPNYLSGIVDCYERRRNVLYNAVSAIPGVEAYKPHGALYMIARMPFSGVDEFAEFLLTDFEDQGETLFLAPANGFYMDGVSGRDKVRLAYVLEESCLQRAAQILERGIRAFQQRS